MKKTSIAILTIASFVGSSAALATMEYNKQYKEKDPAAKCATCHKDAMPKKEAHELNDFGKTVKAAQGKDGKIDWAKVAAPKK